jgi:hypothetical protein
MDEALAVGSAMSNTKYIYASFEVITCFTKSYIPQIIAGRDPTKGMTTEIWGERYASARWKVCPVKQKRARGRIDIIQEIECLRQIIII